MVARNLFRFVSVRPPIPEGGDTACRLANEEIGARFVEVVLARQREHNESLQMARRAVSSAFVDSAEYFARNDLWRDLRPLKKHFQDLVRATCRTEENGEDIDLRTTLSEMVPTLGGEIHDWIGSENFTKVKDSLWRSYYANALIPAVRPNDRPEMLEWIRLLDALERLDWAPGELEGRTDEEGCVCLERLSRARVNMPRELFTETPPPDPVPSKPEDPVEDDIVRLRASLDRLSTARQNLDQLYLRKVSTLRLVPPPNPGHGEAESARSEPVEAEAPLPAIGSEEGPSVHPPWLLTEEDADQLPGLGTELDRLGIPLAGSLVPEVTDALNEAIAADTAVLAALESRVDVLGVGPTMALARRTVRGLQPAPRDGTGSVGQAQPNVEQAELDGEESVS